MACCRDWAVHWWMQIKCAVDTQFSKRTISLILASFEWRVWFLSAAHSIRLAAISVYDVCYGCYVYALLVVCPWWSSSIYSSKSRLWRQNSWLFGTVLLLLGKWCFGEQLAQIFLNELEPENWSIYFWKGMHDVNDMTCYMWPPTK